MVRKRVITFLTFYNTYSKNNNFLDDILLSSNMSSNDSISNLSLEIDLNHNGNGFGAMSEGWDITSRKFKNDLFENAFGYISFSNEENRNIVIMLRIDQLSSIDENNSSLYYIENR